MSSHLTEEEQVENLKRWWKENGRATVTGVVLGLSAIVGWQLWSRHQQDTAEQASMMFWQMRQSVAQSQTESALKQGELIRSQYEKTPYAVLAALELARLEQEQDNAAEAKAQLEWALAFAGEQPLQQIARLRLARMLLSEGDTEGAARLVKEAPADSFAGEFAQLRGDIALANGDRDSARTAYQEALDKEVANTQLVQMKLDDLGAASASL